MHARRPDKARGRFSSSLAAQVAALFAGGQQGAWYEPSSAIAAPWYQDSAGTTPVTAVEQPIGKPLDASGNGNHAIQATAAARPVLSSRVNLLTKSEQFDNAVWLKSDVTVTADTLASPIGTAGIADTVTDSATTNIHRLSEQVVVAVGTQLSLSVYVKDISRRFIILSLNNDANSAVWAAAKFDLQLGTVASTNAAGGTVSSTSITPVGGGWYRCVITGSVATGTSINTFIGLASDGTTYTAGSRGTQNYLGTSASVYIFGAQTNLDGDYRYQFIDTASSYDTAGFPLYEKFDGVDDSLSSATGGGGTAGFFFCAAVKVTGGAGTARTIFGDRGALDGYFVQAAVSDRFILYAGNGTAFTVAESANTAVTIGTTVLLTAYDDGANLVMQVNNNTIASIARPVVTAGTAQITIGKRNNAASEYFPGQIYAQVYRKDSGLTAARRALVKRYVASKAGITL